MKLARLLFKPKWQDKDARVRRVAVAEEQASELVDSLPLIARSDEDAGVRIAALRRLADYEAWRERSTGDADGEVRRVAREAYVALLCSATPKLPTLARRIAELDTLSAAEIERVASRATDRDLRAAALARITRPALLADRALNDPDAALRTNLVDRIDDVAALERVAEAARKTDKAVSRHARERAATLRIGAGNSVAIATRAQLLCVRLEAQLRSGDIDERASQQIEQEWATLGSGVSPDTVARFQGALAVLHQMQFNARNPLPSPPADAESTQAVDEVGVHAAPVAAAASADLIASQARFEAALAAAAGEAQAEREQRRTLLQSIEKLATEYAGQLDAGDFSAARASHQALVPQLSALGTLPPVLEARMNALHARYADLLRWQQWASNNRRQEICAGIEALVTAEAHPDALATRVREARDEWRRLDAADGAGSAESALSRRFNTLCHRALKPTKAYFQKRDELRHARTVEIEALIQRADPVQDVGRDRLAAMTLRGDLSTALRSLDDVDQKARTGLARRIKEAIARLSAMLEQREREIETAKQRLIARAAALQGGDERGVARQARELQQEWTALGSGRRSTDQRQWQEFRKACDAVFAGLDATKKQREVQTQAAQAQGQEILAALEKLRDQDDLSAGQRKAALRELQTRWQAGAHSDRSMQQRHTRVVETIEGSLRAAERSQRLSRFDRALHQYESLRGKELGGTGGNAALADTSAEGGAQDSMRVALDRRLSAPTVATPTTEGAARDLLVELEFIAGVATPEEDRARRMNFQVQRLASRMRDRGALPPEAAIADVLTRWFAQTPQDDALERRFLHAARAAVGSLP